VPQLANISIILLDILIFLVVANLLVGDFERAQGVYLFLEVSALQEREKGVFYRSSASS